MAAGITLCGSLSRHAVSLGAAMHDAGYRALGLRWHYVPFEVTDLAGALAGMRALGIRGFGISMPFKIEILELLDELDPLAARIGAVNTVVNEAGRLIGHNTDWIGAVRALSEALSVEGACVLVLGAGGAARAVCHGLSDAGARVTISNRSSDRSEALAREIGAAHCAWEERAHLEDFDAVINATSCGMLDERASPLQETALRSSLVVMDIVYKPLTTELVRSARAQGAVAIDGGRMLLHQAARQFELYTGRTAPLAAMDAALRAEIGSQI
ncbi:MAG TPA: shikimate dehydrogenase [Polyangiaceae bacterium]|jgi:shikimate dehydrogenase|nr:shikimate dehydrogenase [Polyangiaceae bacterium]